MSLDPKLESKIDTLYKNCRNMPILSIIGCFIPLVLIVCGPYGVVAWFQQRKIIRQLDLGESGMKTNAPPVIASKVPGRISTLEKLEFTRSRSRYFLFPMLVLFLVIAVVIAGVIFVP